MNLDPFVLFIALLLGAVVAAALVLLVWKMRDLATRNELKQETEKLDRDIKANRKETNDDIKRIHDRLDDVIQPLGEIQGSLAAIKEQLNKITRHDHP